MWYSSKNMNVLPGICTISHGLGRIRSCGGPLGSQCSAALSSWPPTARGPINGLAVSNFACPQGVKGGRVRSSTPFMRANAGSVPSANCIQTPERSCELPCLAAELAAGDFLVSDGLLAWAKTTGEKATIAANTPYEPNSG